MEEMVQLHGAIAFCTWSQFYKRDKPGKFVRFQKYIEACNPLKVNKRTFSITFVKKNKKLREPFMFIHKKEKEKKEENLCNIHTFSGVVVAFNLFILKIRKHWKHVCLFI